jgi:hypothetical protein
MASPKIGSNESGYLSLTNGESNVMSGSSKASSIWGDKSLWNLSNSPNSTSSMQTANGSMCSSDGKDSFWHSSTSSPISSASNYNNLTSLWGCSPIKSDVQEESLGSIWNIPQATSSLRINEGNFEAPLPPPISYNQKSQPQLLRPQEIGGSVWSGLNNNSINSVQTKGPKDPVGALWAHPTPPNLPLTLQAQNYNLLSTNSKFQSQAVKPAMGCATSVNNSFLNQSATTSCNANNMQLFSDEFLSYLNMIN